MLISTPCHNAKNTQKQPSSKEKDVTASEKKKKYMYREAKGMRRDVIHYHQTVQRKNPSFALLSSTKRPYLYLRLACSIAMEKGCLTLIAI